MAANAPLILFHVADTRDAVHTKSICKLNTRVEQRQNLLPAKGVIAHPFSNEQLARTKACFGASAGVAVLRGWMLAGSVYNNGGLGDVKTSAGSKPTRSSVERLQSDRTPRLSCSTPK